MQEQHPIQVAILCGGRGTRLREYTETIPKVLVEIGGRPVLWHIMKGFAHHGFRDFVLTLGYLGDKVKQYFLEYHEWRGHDIRLRLGPGELPQPLDPLYEDWDITFTDTGLETNTGGRIKRAERHLTSELFFVTYGDGVADVNLRDLVAFHRSHGRIATVTAVQPSLTFGLLQVDADHRVTRFDEKPPLEAWINGGFFVFDRRVFQYLEPDSVLEREPLERLAADGQLMAYRHRGFWACMDTYKDTERLNQLWGNEEAPWRVWE